MSMKNEIKKVSDLCEAVFELKKAVAHFHPEADVEIALDNVTRKLLGNLLIHPEIKSVVPITYHQGGLPKAICGVTVTTIQYSSEF